MQSVIFAELSVYQFHLLLTANSLPSCDRGSVLRDSIL